MAYKFEKLRVWQRSLDYVDALYEIAEQLPSSEKYNLVGESTHASRQQHLAKHC
jgi:hypothetical protein